jgi:1-acyl-sn-glycerol-3-phosphate acyltransferase
MIAARRLVTIPVACAVAVGALAVSPLLLGGSALMALVARSSLPPRSVALVMAYAVIELRTLMKIATADVDGDGLMRDFLASAYASARKILDVEVVLDPSSASPDSIPRHAPLIVLSRHCGPGDSVLVAWLLMFVYRLRVRIVLKAVLRYEPVLDFAAQRNCLCFLARGERARQQIHDVAAQLSGGQALLLFPEGANFTWPRWHAAIAELRKTDGLRAARRAFRRSYTLPPRAGGATAAVRGAPSANVLVLTHGGFCSDGRDRRWWELPIHRQLLVRTNLVPASSLPKPDQLGEWLERTWTHVDTWVADHTDTQTGISD